MKEIKDGTVVLDEEGRFRGAIWKDKDGKSWNLIEVKETVVIGGARVSTIDKAMLWFKHL